MTGTDSDLCVTMQHGSCRNQVARSKRNKAGRWPANLHVHYRPIRHCGVVGIQAFQGLPHPPISSSAASAPRARPRVGRLASSHAWLGSFSVCWGLVLAMTLSAARSDPLLLSSQPSQRSELRRFMLLPSYNAMLDEAHSYVVCSTLVRSRFPCCVTIASARRIAAPCFLVSPRLAGDGLEAWLAWKFGRVGLSHAFGPPRSSHFRPHRGLIPY